MESKNRKIISDFLGNLVETRYFAVMVTVIKFVQLFFYESQVKYLKKLQKEKSVNDFYIAFLDTPVSL